MASLTKGYMTSCTRTSPLRDSLANRTRTPEPIGFSFTSFGRTLVDMSRSTFRSLASLLISVGLFCSIACSSKDDPKDTTSTGDGDGDGDGDAGGPGEGTGSSSGTGSGNGSGGDSNDGGDGDGDGGETADGPPRAPDCAAEPQIISGRNYGNTRAPYDYSVFAVRLSEDVVNGTYSIRVHDDEDGEAFLYHNDELVDSFDYDPSSSLMDGATQTLAFPDYFELDVRSQTWDDLSALSASLFDGCHQVIITAAEVVQEGGTYGAYQIESLVLDDDAEPGTYTFYAETGNAGSVVVHKDGEEFLTLQYDWMTTVGGGESFTFVFDGLAELTVTRSMGTSNLFALADSLFDGRHELTVD